MRRSVDEPEGWKRMVLRSGPRPKWLAEDAPHFDVVLSSRVRFLRNLQGFRFPHKGSHEELERTMLKVRDAAKPLRLQVYRSLTNAERDYFVGCRLLAPDYPWTLPNRMFLVDGARSLSLMVNEEDHLRLQSLTAGWSIDGASLISSKALDVLEGEIRFAHSERFGYLAASPYNSGEGRRQSAMFHFIGLAQNKRLPSILRALSAKGISVRGLFGESSRAIGAFAQVSLLNGSDEEFRGACEYLIGQEREARKGVEREVLEAKTNHALEFAVRSRLMTLADALRVLGWVRWAANADIPDIGLSVREVDEALTLLDLGGPADTDRAGQKRAVFLREVLKLG